MIHPSLIVFLSLPLLTACTGSVIDLRENLDVHRPSLEEKLAGDSVKVEEFRACTRQAHDGSSLPLSIATDTPATRSVGSPITNGGRLRAPVQALVERIHERVGNNAPSFSVLSDMVDDFADPLRRRLDLDKLRLLTDAIRHWHARLDFDDDALARDTSLFAQLLLAYTPGAMPTPPTLPQERCAGSSRSPREGLWTGAETPFDFPASQLPRRLT